MCLSLRFIADQVAWTSLYSHYLKKLRLKQTWLSSWKKIREKLSSRRHGILSTLHRAPLAGCSAVTGDCRLSSDFRQWESLNPACKQERQEGLERHKGKLGVEI